MFLWEPSVSKKPLQRLTGHMQLINQVKVFFLFVLFFICQALMGVSKGWCVCGGKLGRGPWVCCHCKAKARSMRLLASTVTGQQAADSMKAGKSCFHGGPFCKQCRSCPTAFSLYWAPLLSPPRLLTPPLPPSKPTTGGVIPTQQPSSSSCFAPSLSWLFQQNLDRS